MEKNMNKKNIGIIGTRARDSISDFKKVEKEFLDVYNKGDWIVSGGCSKGGDRFAQKLAKKYGTPILIFYPDWEKKGKGAAFIRNTDIANNSRVLIACVVADRKGGTEDTIEKFKAKEDYLLYSKHKSNLIII
jgi:hypothetical protein